MRIYGGLCAAKHSNFYLLYLADKKSNLEDCCLGIDSDQNRNGSRSEATIIVGSHRRRTKSSTNGDYEIRANKNFVPKMEWGDGKGDTSPL